MVNKRRTIFDDMGVKNSVEKRKKRLKNNAEKIKKGSKNSIGKKKDG